MPCATGPSTGCAGHYKTATCRREVPLNLRTDPIGNFVRFGACDADTFDLNVKKCWNVFAAYLEFRE